MQFDQVAAGISSSWHVTAEPAEKMLSTVCMCRKYIATETVLIFLSCVPSKRLVSENKLTGCVEPKSYRYQTKCSPFDDSGHLTSNSDMTVKRKVNIIPGVSCVITCIFR
jgi:hypothetical protein